MGGRQTKHEDNLSPGTPEANRHFPLEEISHANQSTQTLDDPRSPRGFRTPIVIPSHNECTTVQLVPVSIVELQGGPDKPLDIIRKRFLKGFANNDPRSPSLNRTPLHFDDSIDKTINLDDTFADLFVEANVCDYVAPEECLQEEEEQDTDMPDSSMPSNDINQELNDSPIVQQQKIDPRSPSIGVERTPIILCDDDTEVNEDDFLENILSTLTLNLNNSTDSSFVSLKSSEANEVEDVTADENWARSKPTNKHLERVRVAKKTIAKDLHRRQKVKRQKIYEDCENQTPLTPQIKLHQRSPLSCMRNRVRPRSRSSDPAARLKPQLSFQSIDDTLNPGDNKNETNIKLICESFGINK